MRSNEEYFEAVQSNAQQGEFIKYSTKDSAKGSAKNNAKNLKQCRVIERRAA